MAVHKRGVSLLLAAAVTGGMSTALMASADATPTTTAAKSGAMIVLLRDQHTNLSAAGTHSARARANVTDQASVVRQAESIGASKVRSFQLINGFSAHLTSAQTSALLRDPKVAAVVPDLAIKAPAQLTERAGSAAGARSLKSTGACPSSASKPLLEPEALQLTHDSYVNKKTPQATNLVTGAGVKVAFMADGIDINNPDFIRANGQHVFVDYQDFTGEGPNATSDAAEAFGDASAIAAQGRHVYDLHNFGDAHTIPTGCTIRIQGMAPGASLVGLKVFGNSDSAPTSNFIDAMQYAVNVAHVNIINQSFGSNPYPDNSNDPITLADKAAISAGITVVASTGDAGTTGTIGSPATYSGVIGVAASTQFRSYIQTTGGGSQLSKGTWLSNQISGLSSGGVSQSAKVPDITAPGDLGWALCSADTSIYSGCTDDASNPSTVLQFGGTSQASPLTAGAAALVIAGYRKTHDGVTPSPALVKRFLMSTATDLHMPAYEQGSGLVNAHAAVEAAESYPGKGNTKTLGDNLVLDQTQVSLVGNTGATKSTTVQVRNLSTHAQKVTATVRSLGAAKKLASGQLIINAATAPYYLDPYGIKRAYAKKALTVPAGRDRLTVTVAADANAALRIILIDPKGRYAAYTIPQGVNNYALAEVHNPLGGKWTAYFALSQTTAFHGYLHYAASTANFVRKAVGSKQVAAHGAATFTVRTKLPANPGDASDSVQFAGSRGENVSMPLTLRAVVPAKATTFRGTITGGNGRQALPATASSYYIDVPAKKAALDLDVRLGDPNTLVVGVLIGPNGQAYSVKTNASTFDNAGFNLFAQAPSAGRWVLTLAAVSPNSGDFVSYPFSVKVSYSALTVSAPTLPRSAAAKLASGKSVTVPVKVTNNGRSSVSVFADARLTRSGTIGLAQLAKNATSFTLPQSVTPTWQVPSRLSKVTFTAVSPDAPINLDTYASLGEPELYSASTASGSTNTATTTASASQVTPGTWSADLGEKGPFAAAEPTVHVSVAAHGYGKLFDSQVTSSTGDFWLDGVTGAVNTDKPLELLPGETNTIKVTITPSGSGGAVVHGMLDIDTIDTVNGSADEAVSLPYSYTTVATG